jgi:hypothetical protein
VEKPDNLHMTEEKKPSMHTQPTLSAQQELPDDDQQNSESQLQLFP